MLDDAALVAPHHSAVSGGSSNVRTANRFLRRELAKCSDETAAPHGRLARLGRDLETVAYLPRNRKFESIPLQRRVFCELGF